jgi:hypothetical protein
MKADEISKMETAMSKYTELSGIVSFKKIGVGYDEIVYLVNA